MPCALNRIGRLLLIVGFGQRERLGVCAHTMGMFLSKPTSRFSQGINEEQQIQIRDQRTRIEELEAALHAPRPLQPPELVGQFSATVLTGAPSPLEPRLLRTLDGWCSKARSLRATGPESHDGGSVSASPTQCGARTASAVVQARQAAAPGSTHSSAGAEGDGRPGGSPEPDAATQLASPPVSDGPHIPDAEDEPSPQQLDHEQSNVQAARSSSMAIWSLRI